MTIYEMGSDPRGSCFNLCRSLMCEFYASWIYDNDKLRLYRKNGIQIDTYDFVRGKCNATNDNDLYLL